MPGVDKYCFYFSRKINQKMQQICMLKYSALQLPCDETTHLCVRSEQSSSGWTAQEGSWLPGSSYLPTQVACSPSAAASGRPLHSPCTEGTRHSERYLYMTVYIDIYNFCYKRETNTSNQRNYIVYIRLNNIIKKDYMKDL